MTLAPGESERVQLHAFVEVDESSDDRGHANVVEFRDTLCLFYYRLLQRSQRSSIDFGRATGRLSRISAGQSESSRSSARFDNINSPDHR